MYLNTITFKVLTIFELAGFTSISGLWIYASLHSNALFWPKKLGAICVDVNVCLEHLHTEMHVPLTKYPISHGGVDENKPKHTIAFSLPAQRWLPCIWIFLWALVSCLVVVTWSKAWLWSYFSDQGALF